MDELLRALLRPLVPLVLVLGAVVVVPPASARAVHDAFHARLRVEPHGRCVVTKSDAQVRARLRCRDGLALRLRPCRHEDSRRCFWHAPSRGNGTGRSFVDLHGRTHYFRG